MGRFSFGTTVTRQLREGCVGAAAVLAFAASAAAPTRAAAQRVLECRFVSDADPSSALSHFSFAADISGGQLHMLLMRPPADDPNDPSIAEYEPVRPGVSVHHDIGSSNGNTQAELDLATVGPGNKLRLDEWQFGNGDEYHAIVLQCPSHP